jgi:hypothetical protein
MFDLFTTTDYTFLKLDSRAGGNTVTAEYSANGVVKLRDGMLQADNVEAHDSASTVHVRPSEPFLADIDNNMVGHGIRVTKDGKETVYRVIGQTEGYDFDRGQLEFYRVTVKKEEIAPSPSDLPLQ